MQTTSDTWKSLAAMNSVRVEAKAIINGVEYTDIEPPVISRALMQNGLEVGNVVSAVCQFELETAANISKSAEAKIMARLVGYADDNTPIYSEWLQQGTFSISKRVNDPRMGVQFFECYDALLKTNAVWEPASSVWPQATSSILSEILGTLGLQLDSRTSIVSYMFDEPALGTTMRDVLGIIAQQNGGNWIVTPDNKLRLVPIVDLDESESADEIVSVGAIVDEYYTGEIKTITGVKLTTDEGDVIIGDDTGAVVSLTISGLIAADVADLLIGKTYRPFSYATAYFDIAAELGDYVQSEDSVSVIYAETVTLGTGMHGDVSAPDLAEIDDEYPYVGSNGKTLIDAKAYAQKVGDEAKNAAIAVAAAQLSAAVVGINSDIDNLQSQIDGNITTWFYAVDPTLNNPPANAWTTDAEKNNHLGDLYYNTDNGYCWRFMLADNQYLWQRISDTDVATALANAQHAQDTADGKRRVFITQPAPPYDEGDLWTQGETGDIFVCKNTRASGSYVNTDWENASKYTDDTVANNALATANLAIKGVDVEYAENQSTTTAPTSGWRTTAPTWREGYYIWQRTKTTTAIGSSYSVPTCISGRDGVDGQTGPQGPQGVGIASVTEYYALNNSTTAPEDSAFSTGVKTPTASNRYVWNYELITYTDNSTSKTAKHIAATYGETGQAGATGNGISSVTDYYAVNNSTTAPADSAFSTTISLPTASNKYLWNYELITYTNGTTSKTGKRVIGTYGEKGNTGDQGQTGVGVSGVVEQYYLSTSSTTQTGGSWSTSQPQWASGKYIWTRSQVTWTNGTTTTTTPVLAQAINGANSTANAANSTANAANSTANAANDTANAASAAVTALDNALNQQEIFNRLTNNGAAQGMVLYNGQLYVNATYINAGYLSATRIQGGTLTLGGQNEAHGDMTIVDGSDNVVARIYSAGIAFADTSSLHGVKISRSGVVELSQISVYGSSAQLKAKILPLTSEGIAIADANSVSFASFSTGSSSIKSSFSVNDGSGGLLSVSGGHISLTDSNGSKLWMPGNGEVEVQAALSVTQNITAQHSGDVLITAKNAQTKATVELDSAPSGNHGIYTNGYYNGSAYVASGAWMIYRNTSGNVIVNGTASGNVAKSGDTMTGNLTVQHTGDVSVHVKNTNTSNSLFLYNPDNGRQGLYTFGYWNGSKYVESSKWLIYRSTDGNVYTDGVYIAEHQTDAGVIARCTQTGVNIWIENMSNGKQGLWSNGYWNGTAYVSSSKWLIYRNTAGHVIIDGNATTRENLGTYLYLDNATPATVYAKLSALNSNETVNIAMSQAVTNYLTGTKVNIYLTGQVRKSSANEYRFMAYRTDGAKMYIWQATVTADGVSNVSGYQYSGTTI